MREFLANLQVKKLLMEHIPAAMAIFDRDMRYLAYSHRWLADYRISAQDLIGRSHYEVCPEISQSLKAIHRRALSGETLSSEAEAIPRGDGSVDWVKWEITPWLEADGTIGGVVLFSELLTQVIETTRNMRSLSFELNLLIDSATDHAICLLDPDGRVIIWNSGAERLYGWGENEIVGKPYEMMFQPDEIAADLPARQLAVARENGTFSGRFVRRRKDSSSFLAEVSINCINDESGALIGFGQVVRDVTREVEENLAQEAVTALLRSILDTVPDAMITIDDLGHIQSFSAAAETLFGYSAAEVVGCNISMLMPEPDATRHDGYLARYKSTGERRIMCNSRRVMGRRKDGSVFPHTICVGEAYGGGRRIFTGFLRDLTDQEQAEKQLRELQGELIHIARVSAIGTMATALAHELNQPLIAITNYVQSSAAILARPGERELELVRTALAEAGTEALRAGAIVQRLREFVARGELERTIARPEQLAAQACKLGAVGTRSNGISCEVRTPSGLRPVLVDQVQIQQVLLNLIRNACEALENSGSIIVEVANDGPLVRFSVIDDGPGIASGQEEVLFEPFISTKASGLGVGLAICRTIVEAHGGTMWCEAAQGRGAAFHFTVPAAEFDDD